MADSEYQIKTEIKQYIDNNGGSYSSWYVGITGDPKVRLFEQHDVHENGDNWIWKEAGSNQEARNIESYFVNDLGTSGDTGGGDDSSVYVYAYKMNSHTEP